MQILKKNSLVMVNDHISIKRDEIITYMSNFSVITKEDNHDAIREFILLVQMETGVTMTMDNVHDRFANVPIKKWKRKITSLYIEKTSQKQAKKKLMEDAQKALREKIEEGTLSATSALDVLHDVKTRKLHISGYLMVARFMCFSLVFRGIRNHKKSL